MTYRILSIVVISSSLILGGCASNQGPKETAGTIIGGVAGAVVGAQFGQGTGQIVGTGIGAVVGSYLGNTVGKSLDEKDKTPTQ